MWNARPKYRTPEYLRIPPSSGGIDICSLPLYTFRSTCTPCVSRALFEGVNGVCRVQNYTEVRFWRTFYWLISGNLGWSVSQENHCMTNFTGIYFPCDNIVLWGIFSVTSAAVTPEYYCTGCDSNSVTGKFLSGLEFLVNFVYWFWGFGAPHSDPLMLSFAHEQYEWGVCCAPALKHHTASKRQPRIQSTLSGIGTELNWILQNWRALFRISERTDHGSMWLLAASANSRYSGHNQGSARDSKPMPCKLT